MITLTPDDKAMQIYKFHVSMYTHISIHRPIFERFSVYTFDNVSIVT